MNKYLTCIYRVPNRVKGLDYPDIVQDCMSFPNPDKDPKALEQVRERAQALARQGFSYVEPVLITAVGEMLNRPLMGYHDPLTRRARQPLNPEEQSIQELTERKGDA